MRLLKYKTLQTLIGIFNRISTNTSLRPMLHLFLNFSPLRIVRVILKLVDIWSFTEKTGLTYVWWTPFMMDLMPYTLGWIEEMSWNAQTGTVGWICIQQWDFFSWETKQKIHCCWPMMSVTLRDQSGCCHIKHICPRWKWKSLSFFYVYLHIEDYYLPILPRLVSICWVNDKFTNYKWCNTKNILHFLISM